MTKHKGISQSLGERKRAVVDPFKAGFEQKHNYDMKSIRLAFQAFVRNQQTGEYSIVVPPIRSDSITDIKDPGDLTMIHLSHKSGPAQGHQQVTIVTSAKFDPDNLRVFFIGVDTGEGTSSQQEPWIAEAPIVKHMHKVVLVVQTPTYPELQPHESSRDVKIVLERKVELGHKVRSPPLKYTYTQDKHTFLSNNDAPSRKRKRASDEDVMEEMTPVGQSISAILNNLWLQDAAGPQLSQQILQNFGAAVPCIQQQEQRPVPGIICNPPTPAHYNPKLVQANPLLPPCESGTANTVAMVTGQYSQLPEVSAPLLAAAQSDNSATLVPFGPAQIAPAGPALAMDRTSNFGQADRSIDQSIRNIAALSQSSPSEALSWQQQVQTPASSSSREPALETPPPTLTASGQGLSWQQGSSDSGEFRLLSGELATHLSGVPEDLNFLSQEEISRELGQVTGASFPSLGREES